MHTVILWSIFGVFVGAVVFMFALVVKDEQLRRKKVKPDDTISLALEPLYERFTPIPLLKGRSYNIVLKGVYHYRNWGNWSRADACYDAVINFKDRYKKLSFDGKPAPDPSYEDRHTHVYIFSYVGTGQKLVILLEPPRSWGRLKGNLAVVIRPLTVKAQAALDDLVAWIIPKDALSSCFSTQGIT